VETIVKLYPPLISHLVEIGVKGYEDNAYIDRSYNVFNAGVANYIAGGSATIGVPMANDIYLDAMTIIRTTLKNFETKNLYFTGPLSVRFVKGSPQILLFEPEDVCKFEFLFGGDSEDIHRMVSTIISQVFNDLRNKYGEKVTFHWGQFIPEDLLTKDVIERSFPKFKRWLEIQKKFDPDGRGLNEWQEKVFTEKK